MTTVVKLQKGGGALTPSTLDEAMRFADLMSKSSIVPKDYQGQPGNILVAVQWGQEVGLPPLQAMQNIAVINGRPSLWGDSLIALVQSSGLLEYIKEDPQEDGCTCIVKRKGQPEVERTFTMEDAKRAGLAGKSGPWQQYPKRMLQMRARAFALRDVFPDVLRGMYVAEEARDLPREMKDVTPAEEAPKRGVEGVKEKLARKKAAAKEQAREEVVEREIVGPGLAEVLDAIRSAKTEADLEGVKGMAAALPDDDKVEARTAWKARQMEIKEPVKQDGVTVVGLVLREIENGAPIDATLSFYAEAIDRLDDAESKRLDDAIGRLRDEQERADAAS